MIRPLLLVAFYANPAQYPPTYNAIRLLREHFRVHVVCRDVGSATIEWPEGVTIERVGPGGSNDDRMVASSAAKLREYGAFVLALRRALGDRPRVALGYDPHAFVALRAAGCWAPIVYQRHEVEEIDKLDMRSFGGWIVRASLALSRTAAVVVFPEKHRAEYYARFVRDRRPPIIVPNFPLLSVFPPLPEGDSLFDRRFRKREVFYRGALGPHTGVREAALSLSHLDEAVTMRIAGLGSAEFVRDLEARVASIGAARRFTNEGFIPSYEELNRRTLEASVGVMLYQAATTNMRHTVSAANKIYEYAACGLPVVVPDRAEYREYLAGETWIDYADEADPRSIAGAIQRILADRDDYDARCKAARRAFEDRFNYETAFRPMLDAILALASLPRPGA